MVSPPPMSSGMASVGLAQKAQTEIPASLHVARKSDNPLSLRSNRARSSTNWGPQAVRPAAAQQEARGADGDADQVDQRRSQRNRHAQDVKKRAVRCRRQDEQHKWEEARTL